MRISGVVTVRPYRAMRTGSVTSSRTWRVIPCPAYQREAGWRVVGIESERGAPPPDAAGFLAATEGWPGRDVESLATYQWIASAAAGA